MTNYERFSEGFEKTEEIQIEAVKMLLDQIMEDYQSGLFEINFPLYTKKYKETLQLLSSEGGEKCHTD